MRLGRYLRGHAFVEQEIDGADTEVGVEASHQGPVAQRVVHGRQDHALVVRHVGVHGDEASTLGHTLRGEVRGLVEAVLSEETHRLDPAQVPHRSERVAGERERRRVGSHHCLLLNSAPQTELRDAEPPVPVVPVRVDVRVARLGHAPGHAPGLGVPSLRRDSGTLTLREERAGLTPEQQRRHQVLEHGAAPGEQAGPASRADDRPPQVEPVLQRHVSLGDGQEARDAGLRRQQVVLVRIEAVSAGVVAEVEQAALSVPEQAEVHREGRLLRLRRRLDELRKELAGARRAGFEEIPELVEPRDVVRGCVGLRRVGPLARLFAVLFEVVETAAEEPDGDVVRPRGEGGRRRGQAAGPRGQGIELAGEGLHVVVQAIEPGAHVAQCHELDVAVLVLECLAERPVQVREPLRLQHVEARPPAA